jgi:hypothetical protein
MLEHTTQTLCMRYSTVAPEIGLTLIQLFSALSFSWLQRRPYATSRGGRSIHYIFPDEGMAMGAAPRGLPPGYGRGGGAPYNGRGGQRGSPVGGLVQIATNLLLQLPFSR